MYVCMYIYVCMYVCIYIYIYLYIYNFSPVQARHDHMRMPAGGLHNLDTLVVQQLNKRWLKAISIIALPQDAMLALSPRVHVAAVANRRSVK